MKVIGIVWVGCHSRQRTVTPCRVPVTCKHSFIHVVHSAYEALSAGVRTWGLPLFQAPLQSAFLLILKLCHTVNLFQSQNLFKWICSENFIQARTLFFFFFFYCVHLKEHLSFLFSGNRSGLFSQEREKVILIGGEKKQQHQEYLSSFYPYLGEIQGQMRRKLKGLDPGEINHQ